MDIAELQSTQHLVLWAAFGVAAVFGFIAQRTHFCTMGAISDIVNMGDWTRMRMWAMAVGVAAIGFYGLAWLGVIDSSKTIYTGARVIWLSALAGGALFGFGMVLASGCGSKTLVRIGAGSLKSLVVFFVMGFAAFATLRGMFAVVRVNTVDQVAFEIGAGGSVPAWLAALTGWDAGVSGLAAALFIGGALVLWALAGEGFRSANNLLAGLGIGLVIATMWWVSGHLGFVEEHPETLESVYLATNTGRMESLTFTAPMAYALDWIIFFSDTSKVLTLGVVTVFGVVVGAFVQAMIGREFRWEGFRSTQDTALHLVGAVCMGVGGVTALGCTVGQGLSGLSTLSLVSMIAVAGIVVGAVLGFRFQMWLLERE
ncbi:MAG TPA: YeeE/YedE family protein [Hydrogenophaga sp.]|uniref:YeeE/YedE family protein n=1 Tax=Hydrogenophaga sp. TaxID=1904254 RepID=UPI002C77DB99|nr:YeeE/YedE family protein [Hydrogenophaga sp.]HMN92406.1 YeeE/YedE family protein [Hydrogenophaga sp.]HMP10178.1 YeeE/YedE family protein [Hydrogenophaga sp.]